MRHLFYSIRNPKLETTGANTSSIKPLPSCTRTRLFVFLLVLYNLHPLATPTKIKCLPLNSFKKEYKLFLLDSLTACFSVHVMSKHPNAGLAHFKQFQYFHRNVSGFASSILSPPWLPEWSDPEKRTGFDLYCKKLQRPFTLLRRGSFGVIYNVSLRIHKCLSPCHTLNSSREFLRLWSRIPVLKWTNGIWSCLMIRWLTPVKTSELWTSLLVVLIIAIWAWFISCRIYFIRGKVAAA